MFLWSRRGQISEQLSQISEQMLFQKLSRTLRRLTNQAKFMHSDLGKHWYSMSASLNRIAAD